MQIVDLFYELARQHKLIRGFYYGKAYEKGAANEAYPLLWLDDPIYGQSVNQAVQYTVNVDILGIPKDEKDTVNVQTEAFNTGLSIVEKIRQSRIQTGYSVGAFNFVSLRDYYDDNAAGFRFTYTVIHANPVNRCAEDFDPSKQFGKADALPHFEVDNPEGCAVFNDKPGLPDFKIPAQ
jgi:hypothetical protein